MKQTIKLTRRSFLQRSSLGIGTGIIGSFHIKKSFAKNVKPVDKLNRLPREVWIAGLTHGGLEAQTYEEMLNKMLKRMEEVVPYQPDIVCLPESCSESDSVLFSQSDHFVAGSLLKTF